MPLVREFADEYIEQAKMINITYKNDIAKFRDYVLSVIGDLCLVDVSPRDIQLLPSGPKGKQSNGLRSLGIAARFFAENIISIEMLFVAT